MSLNVQETRFVGLLLAAATAFLLGLSGCSSGPTAPESDNMIGSAGPTVLYAKTEPGTIELNRDLQPVRTPMVTADVKDFKSKVTDVKLQFSNVPLEVPMKNVKGTTWEAELTPRQLEMLAVSGKTMKYEAQVIAKNEDGQIAMGQQPVEVQVKAPKLSEST